MLASDGYINDYVIELCLNKKDEKILLELKDIICPDKPLYNKPNTHSIKLSICSKNMLCQKIKKVFNMKSNNKHSEITFPNIPTAYIKDFIRGVIDGDGCIDTTKSYSRNGNISIIPRLRILSNYNFLEKLNEVTKEFIPHNTKAIRKRGAENVWEITYNGATARSIIYWCYNNSKIRLDRKYEKYEKVCNVKI